MLALRKELAQVAYIFSHSTEYELELEKEERRAKMRQHLRLWGYYLRSENESCIAQQTGQIKVNPLKYLTGATVGIPQLSEAEIALAEQTHKKINSLNHGDAEHHRALLKLHYVNNVPQTAIARIYRKDYSTVKRWFESIVDKLLVV